MKSPEYFIKTRVAHIIFWCIIGLIMLLLLGAPSGDYGYTQSLIFVLLLLPVLAGSTYLLLYYLVPRYLLKRRFFLFGLYTSFVFIAAAWMEVMIVMGLLILVYQYQVQLINPRITDMGYLFGMTVLVILPAISILITRQWYRERQVTDQLQQEKLELELVARQKELDYLKEQMHPHFLFNVLNNLYGLTLEKSDEAPELVLKVSDMLDYMLYRSSSDLVPLQDELDHISNYIEIQKMRCDERLKLHTDIEADAHHYQIAPMILLPFVENSFKHGVSRSSSDNFINIRIHIENDHLEMHVNNSLVSENSSRNGQGVGLRNVEKRLELLYKENYQLKTKQTEHQFRVDLSIPLTRGTDEEMEMHDRG